MTITGAWIRTLRDCKELIVVSDSRLNGGKKMDCGQKVMALPRSDAFICFAGSTGWAYPLMHQVFNAISTYEKSASRAQDITELKTHVLKIFEGLRGSVHDAYGTEGVPSAEFLFGGYSWIRKEFLIWRIHFHVPKLRKLPKGGPKAVAEAIAKKSCFVATPASVWKGQQWVFAGDEVYVKQARTRLAALLRSRGKAPDQVSKFKFEWEPFEVVRDMLREVDASAIQFRNADIGGAPQVLKIYEHLSSRYLAVEWETKRPNAEKAIYICGRKLLGYETPTLWILNPDTMISRHAFYSEKQEQVAEEAAQNEV